MFVLAGAVFFSCKKDTVNDSGNPPCNLCPFDFRLTDFEPAWSPNGRTIAYVHGDTTISTTGIWLIDTNGTNRRLLVRSAGAYSPAWSPDGLWIAYSDGAQIFKITVNGDSLARLTTEGRNFFPAWSPDGQWVVYSRSVCEGPNTCGVWLMSTTGSQQRFLAAFGNYPSWHPFDRRILYATRSVANGQDIGDSVWTLSIETNVKSLLIFLSGLNYINNYLKYTINGKIVFSSQPNGGAPQIWVMNADGSNLVQLTSTQGYAPAWSPDGEWIVYTDSRAVSGRLWLMRKDGSEKRQFTF